MVLICGSHVLDYLFSLCFCNAPVFGQDLGQDCVDLASHVSSVTADVEVSLLLQELVDLLATLLQPVLDVNLLSLLS